jgi:head-tail adaptor
MAVITSADLNEMRAVRAATFTDTCDILRPAYTSDGLGGYTETLTTAASDVPCVLAPSGSAGGDEVVTADRDANAAEWMITMEWGTVVQPKDRILIGARTFEVQRIRSTDRSRGISMRVQCTEVL